MGCPQCDHPNSETAKFCEECGTRLITACPQCGSLVSPAAKFCAECGTPLTGQVSSSKFQVPSPQPPTPSTQPPTVVSSPSPAAYTPAHLAERIHAVSLTEGERKTITAL